MIRPVWNALINLQARVRDYVAVLGLELVLDEAEGYAFLRSRPESRGRRRQSCRAWSHGDRSRFRSVCCWRCCARKLAEFDASGGDTRLVLSRDEMVELMRVFLPESSNEAKLDRPDRNAAEQDRRTGLSAPLEGEARSTPKGTNSKCGASSKPLSTRSGWPISMPASAAYQAQLRRDGRRQR